MMNNNDIRPGRNRFPYGDRHDFGISLDKVVGSAEIPGTTVDETYVAITLHKSYYEQGVAQVESGERTIYINASLLKNGLVTIRLGQAFSSSSGGQSHLYGRVAGVVGSNGLIGIFSWRIGAGTLELFPDSAMTVFESVLTAAQINGTSWGGAEAYAAATTGAPLYYFVWDEDGQKLSEPVRRVIPTDDGPSPFPSSDTYFGVFVPVTDGVVGTPIAALYLAFEATIKGCIGGVSVRDLGFVTTPDNNIEVGSVDLSDASSWGSFGGYSDGITDVASIVPRTTFDYMEEFPSVASLGHTAGYLFKEWYDPELAIDDPAQNSDRIYLTEATFISNVRSLDDYVGFSGTAESPEEMYLNLAPVEGAQPSASADLEFTVSATEETRALSASVQLAYGFAADGVYFCGGRLLYSMWMVLNSYKTLKYNKLSKGTQDGQLMYWDAAVSKWRGGLVGTSPSQVLTWDGAKWGAASAPTGSTSMFLPSGTTNCQLLYWDAPSGAWKAGLTGTAEGQVLKWNGTGWTAGLGSLPSGADKNTIYYDGTTGWTANARVKWTKLTTGSPSSGGVMLLDLTGCPARAWNSAMPGFAIAHPSGGTCGLFANIESGNDAGARLDMGWGGANGGNFELYANSHPTRPGEFRVIYGPNGHIEFKKYVSGTDWRVTSGLSKEGRLFCGFNDAQFPGVTGNVGTNVAPAFPFQVFNEGSQDSKVVAGVSKEGRGFFGCLGNPPTGLPAFPLEIYNEAGATASSRVAGITKNGRAFFGVSGSTAPTPEHPLEIYNEAGSTAAARKVYVTKDGKIVTSATVSSIAHTAQLDCNDIAMTTGATAQTVKLREMVIPYKSGSSVKGKLAQVMCGAGYGDELDLSGLPTGNTANQVLGTNASNQIVWLSTQQLTWS